MVDLNEVQRLAGAVEYPRTGRILVASGLAMRATCQASRFGIAAMRKRTVFGFGAGNFASRQRRATSSDVERAVRCWRARKCTETASVTISLTAG